MEDTSNPSPHPPPQNESHLSDRAPSPSAPPYSPITPTMSASLPSAPTNPSKTTTTTTTTTYPHFPPSSSNPTPQNATTTPQPAQTHQNPPPPPPQQQPAPPPPSQPISLTSNPDAIALRAAMSILQIQRQQAIRDMQTLEAQKERAVGDPEGFARGVGEGRVRSRDVRGVGAFAAEDDEIDDDDDDDDDDEAGGDREGGEGEGKGEEFGIIPSAQNVVRMPPVNWAKYHVVGESLERLHEEQRRRPSAGQPLREEEWRGKGRESVVAAPYDPWVDRLGEGGRGRGGGKKRG